VHLRDTFCVIVPNFMKIGHTVAKMGLMAILWVFLVNVKIH